MKPQRKTDWVAVFYWSCLEQAHRHRDEESAAGCIEQTLVARKKILLLETRRAQYKSAAEKYVGGATLKQLADELGTSQTTVRHRLTEWALQVISKHNYSAPDYDPDGNWHWGLTTFGYVDLAVHLEHCDLALLRQYAESIAAESFERKLISADAWLERGRKQPQESAA